MNLFDEKDKLVFDKIHEQLLKYDPWGDEKNGEFIGRIVFDETLSTSIDVPVYDFNVNHLIDNFILVYECGKEGDFDDEGIKKAKAIIASMNRMIMKLEDRIKDV